MSPLRKAHVTFDREEIGKKTAGKHDDETRVREMNAEFPPRPTETLRVRGDQIDQQDRADEMSAGKNRNLETAAFRRPPDKQALKVTLLRFVNTEMNLRERAGEDEHHRRGEADDRQLQRRDKIDKFAQHLFRIGRTGEISRTSAFLFRPRRLGR